MKLKLLSVAAASVLSTSAIAAPSIATNGMGDFLIAPAFYAQGNFKTDLKIVNTDLNSSMVVRAVVRDSARSNEVDFVILLSPGDVWTGNIAEVDGKPTLTSDDDSNYCKYAKHAEMKKCGDKLSIVLPNINPNFKWTSGYVEFYPMMQFNETGLKVAMSASDTTCTKTTDKFTDTLGQTVCKPAISQRFENLAYNGGVTVDTVFGIAGGFAGVNPVEVGDSLMGEVTVSSTSMKSAMTLPMVAFDDASSAVTLATDFISMKATENTRPTLYLSNATAISTLLADDQLAFTYDNSGENNNILFTYWNDTTAGQYRKYSVQVRNETECACLCDKVVVTNPTCLTCTPTTTTTTTIDPVSGAVVNPTVTPAKTATCTIQVNNEFGQLSAKTIVATADCSNGDWSKGWVNLTYGETSAGAANNNNAVIPTQMRAKVIDGQVSYNWNYVSTKDRE